MRFLRQSLTGLFLLSVTLGLLIWAGSLVRDAVQERMAREDRPRPARERVFAVNVVRAEPTEVTPLLSAFGEVESRRTLEIRAATPGQIVEIAEGFEDGADVVEGALLMRIDPSAAEEALARAEVDVQDAEAELRDAEAAIVLANDELAAAEEQSELRQRAFARQVDLSDRGVGTAAAVETAEIAASSARQAVLTRRQALAQANARMEQARTRRVRGQISLSEAERKLGDTEIRARFSGKLSDVTAIAGGLVTTNVRLAQLVDPNALEVAVRVPTEAFARLLDENGALRPAPVRIVLDVLGVDMVSEGVLVRDSAAVAEGQTGRLVFARLHSPRGLKPGDFVSVEIEEPKLNWVIVLPAMAINAANEVLVVGEEDRLEAVSVNPLRRQGNDVLVRSRGLAGREVVAERSPLLGAGIKVRPLRPTGEGEVALEEPEMVQLDPERRAKLLAFVEANGRIPAEAKARILSQLQRDEVPVRMVNRIEGRMGG